MLHEVCDLHPVVLLLLILVFLPFSLSDVPWERVCAMSSLNVVDLRSNPLTSSPHTSQNFTLLT